MTFYEAQSQKQTLKESDTAREKQPCTRECDSEDHQYETLRQTYENMYTKSDENGEHYNQEAESTNTADHDRSESRNSPRRKLLPALPTLPCKPQERPHAKRNTTQHAPCRHRKQKGTGTPCPPPNRLCISKIWTQHENRENQNAGEISPAFPTLLGKPQEHPHTTHNTMQYAFRRHRKPKCPPPDRTSSRGRLLVLAKIPPGVPVILNPIVELLNESYSLHSCRSSQKAYPAHASTIRSVGSTCFICASSGHSLRSQHLDLDRSPSAAEMQGMNTI
eukprot:338889-Prorocentrum_minimum.AAC.2